MESQDFTAGIGDRYKQIRAHFGHSREALGTIAGVSGTSIGNIEEGKHTPKAESVAAIARKLGISLEWLLFGEGSMLAAAPSSLMTELDSLVPPPVVQHLPPLTVTVDISGDETIPIVESEATAGYLAQHMEPEFLRNLPMLALPLPEFKNGTFRAFRVKGRSMYPTLHDGSLVLCRFVDTELETIKDSYVHVVVTYEGIVVKRVYTGRDSVGGLEVRSDNDEFPPYTIKKGEWQQLWCVVASLNFQMPAPRKYPTKQLYSFELEEMRNRLEILWKNYTGQ
ncbi:XRE family transcriptional regulator [Hymenobacter rigui]|uniref:LexA family transcriptional regulator n=1 Tax=Hymenobacter rigui TaxID=334424 RepID=A0A3R9N7H8_9BACT|nr:LexA family transcriptional regulator [Hymenobacter rigui]RSK50066.1 LexA family transcriptional regulator [Hymenobacter rigui]